MDKKEPKKNKNKKPPTKPRSGKKRTVEGPSCSMFLVELSRKLAQQKKEGEDKPDNIVGSILSSITNALPVVVQKSIRAPSPVKIETLQSLAPELQPNDVLETPNDVIETPPTHTQPVQPPIEITDAPVQEVKKKFKVPRMPVITSDVFKQKRAATEDAAVNTSSNHDMASHLAKYVDTLKKISLISEEFNQKTAKNLKEIVDSVQEDLQQKLELLVNEQKTKVDQPMQVVQEDIEHARSSQK